MAIIELSSLSEERLTEDEVLARVRKLGLQTPAEAVRMIRADGDAR